MKKLAIEDLKKIKEKVSEIFKKHIMGDEIQTSYALARGREQQMREDLPKAIHGEKRGEPRPRPPFPAIAGLWRKPSVLNNVETLSGIGQIILNGAEWFAEVGTSRSRGTKIFALTGDVLNVGLVEVPMGTPLGTIVFDIGGGIPDGKRFKAAQLGGPSGGCIPVQHLNAQVDYETVAQLGAIMGSGGMIVMNEDKCAVDMARFFMDFCQGESCGKCVPCREGTKRMLEILNNICGGKGAEGDIDLLKEMAENIKRSALCGLGQTAPNPVLSTLKYFQDEYEAGGWMRWGIPAYRLPRDILAEEIEQISNFGVEIRTNSAIGKDISLNEIEEQFDYIFSVCFHIRP